MKKWLVGVSVAACLAVAMPSDALAQLPVTDGGNLVAQAKNLLQELKSYATELEQLSQQVQQVTWLAQTAAHRLKLEAGRQAIAEWERENGPLTEAELADGLARARSSLGRAPDPAAERRSA